MRICVCVYFFCFPLISLPSSIPSLSSPLPQSPLVAEDLNISEYTHRILFGGRTAESFSSPSPLECQEYPFKVRGRGREGGREGGGGREGREGGREGEWKKGGREGES